MADGAPRRPTIYRQIPTAALIAHPGNIREDIGDTIELADSIRQVGLLQPLTVKEHPTLPDRYILLAGHRRARAALEAGLRFVPCTVRDVHSRDEELSLMLIENCQRKDLNPIEQAFALGALQESDSTNTQERLSKMTGMSIAWVSQRLALLELSPEEQQRIIKGEVKQSEMVKVIKQRRKAERDGIEYDRGWDPPYFTRTHQLARRAARVCDGRDHNQRRRVGNVACGQCWEKVIRDDERKVIAVEQSLEEEPALAVG